MFRDARTPPGDNNNQPNNQPNGLRGFLSSFGLDIAAALASEAVGNITPWATLETIRSLYELSQNSSLASGLRFMQGMIFASGAYPYTQNDYVPFEQLSQSFVNTFFNNNTVYQFTQSEIFSNSVQFVDATLANNFGINANFFASHVASFQQYLHPDNVNQPSHEIEQEDNLSDQLALTLRRQAYAQMPSTMEPEWKQARLNAPYQFASLLRSGFFYAAARQRSLQLISFANTNDQDRVASFMENHGDCYQILNIESSATEKAIREAFKKEILACHPDRNINFDIEAKKRSQKVIEAYTILNDAGLKKIHDQLLTKPCMKLH